MNDLKFAFRQLRKNPGFTDVAVLTLALGIGANTAIFSVVNAVLLRSLPFPHADRLVTILTTSQRDGRYEAVEAMFDPHFKAWREQTGAFEQMAAYGGGQSTLLSGGEAERFGLAEVAVDFFAMLGIRPLLGRTFRPEEHEAGSPRVAQGHASGIPRPFRFENRGYLAGARNLHHTTTTRGGSIHRPICRHVQTAETRGAPIRWQVFIAICHGRRARARHLRPSCWRNTGFHPDRRRWVRPHRRR